MAETTFRFEFKDTTPDANSTGSTPSGMAGTGKHGFPSLPRDTGDDLAAPDATEVLRQIGNLPVLGNASRVAERIEPHRCYG